MELLDLKSLNVTTEGSRDMIKFLAQKRGISTKRLLSTIKTNPRRKNNKNLITKSQQELRKTQQKLVKSQRELIKSQGELIKSQRELKKTQQRLIKPTKPQQTLSNTKERIEVIRKKLNELRNNFSRSELKEMRNHLYNIENKNDLKIVINILMN